MAVPTTNALRSTVRQSVSGELALTVCGWCTHFGRAGVAGRPAKGGQWRQLVRGEAGAEAGTNTGAVSHGLCPACRPLLLREWGLDQQHSAAA
jgi:hypothetical protein